MTFYHECLGGDLYIMTFGEAHAPCGPADKDRIMHARLRVGDATIMASDTMPGMAFTPGNNFNVSVECETDEEVDTLFNALGKGGKPLMPPAEQFWGARFAMAADRFGITWMFNSQHAPLPTAG
mgnify:CR=1 FL=1